MIGNLVPLICPSHLHEILLHAEVLDDELLPLGRILAH